ncbi:haloalkane dehalogenase [Euzebya tangerina]|uniref:haloalkane dehalogenase n=1 Tax=Euzebya tangerina TaxID=591198 RepID=UPI0013C30B47|nr:haloalkane dehalogenase [Euzebya tangerina]
MRINWITAMIDVPASARQRTDAFWAAVTATTPGPARGEQGQFVTLEPRSGMAVLKRQVLDEQPRIHLDLHSDDPFALRDRAVDVGAEHVADHEDFAIVRSPAGVLLCTVPHRITGHRPAPIDWPGGSRSRLDQVCVDVDPAVFEDEVAFWVGLTGWSTGKFSRSEFLSLERPVQQPFRILLQRRDLPTPDRPPAHLDIASDNTDAEVDRHLDLGARVVGRFDWWTVLEDPAGLHYCVTRRDPVTSLPTTGSARMPYLKHHHEVQDVPLATVDLPDAERLGGRPTIVFLHGNPTSSYLWRNVIPHVADLGRVVAPDLMGMGDSGLPPVVTDDTYSFMGHSRVLDGLLEALDIGDRVVFVLNDWGSALGFDWARRHPDRVTGIAYTEAICGPRSMATETDDDRDFFSRLRGPEGERMVLVDNVFVEHGLQAATLVDLPPEVIDVYRAPFVDPGERRRVMLRWPREIPFDGDPAEVHDRVVAYRDWLRTTAVPKLWIRADPGSLTPLFASECETWPNQTEAAVPAIHFVAEDAPAELGQALRRWLGTIAP